jgi:hypothetical protein
VGNGEHHELDSHAHFWDHLLAGLPKQGVTAITLGGFPEEINGETRGWLNGRYDPRTGSDFEINFRETYWSADGMLFLFKTAQGKWMINHVDNWSAIRSGKARGYCSTEIGEILSTPMHAAFTRVFDGKQWVSVRGARVMAFHNPSESLPALSTDCGRSETELAMSDAGSTSVEVNSVPLERN